MTFWHSTNDLCCTKLLKSEKQISRFGHIEFVLSTGLLLHDFFPSSTKSQQFKYLLSDLFKCPSVNGTYGRERTNTREVVGQLLIRIVVSVPSEAENLLRLTTQNERGTRRISRPRDRLRFVSSKITSILFFSIRRSLRI